MEYKLSLLKKIVSLINNYHWTILHIYQDMIKEKVVISYYLWAQEFYNKLCTKTANKGPGLQHLKLDHRLAEFVWFSFALKILTAVIF